MPAPPATVAALADQWPLAAAWLAYCALHSLLASLTVKRWAATRFPAAFPAYRLAFNGLSALLLLPILALLHGRPGPTLWQWQGIHAWVANGLAAAAVAAFWHSLAAYDMAVFLGTRQLNAHSRAVEDLEPFRISFWHRFVRHPWYCFGLVILWTRDMSAALFVSAVAITFYFWLGSRLEERKLVALYGEAYRDYMRRVPGLVPRPWRFLRRDDPWLAAQRGPSP